MRRDLALLIATAAVVMMILGGTLLLPAAERTMRHADAKAAQPALPSPVALLSGYSAAFSALLSGDYSNASELVSLINSSYVPENVRYIFSRFNSLLGSAVVDLNQTEMMAGAAWKALCVGDLEEARGAIRNASVSLWRANSTASQAKEASSALASQLRIQQLGEELGSLDYKIEQLSANLSAARSELERIESGGAVRTSVTISLDRYEAWVGSQVTAYGSLTTEEGSPISGTVHLSIPGFAEYTTTAGWEDGSYSLTFQVPYAYTDSIRVYAYFTPEDGSLAGSRSQEAVLSLIWIRPEVAFDLNATRAMPGQVLQVSGVTGLGVPRANVRVSAFGSSYLVASSGGEFTTTIRVPEGVQDGYHTIRAEVVPSGIIGPGSYHSAVEVYRLPTTVVLDLPFVSFSGGRASISGRVSAAGSGPGLGALVSISVGGETYSVSTGEEGLFACDVPLGIAVPTGWLEVTARAAPSEATYQPSSVRSGFYAVNPSIFTALIGGSALLYLSFSQGKRGSGKGSGGRGGGDGGAGGVLAADGAGGSPKTMSPVVAAYHRASAAVGAFIGQSMRKSETLREFFRRSEGKVGEASEPFSELTAMAEEELYAGRRHEPARAEPLLERIVSALSRAIPFRKGEKLSGETDE